MKIAALSLALATLVAPAVGGPMTDAEMELCNAKMEIYNSEPHGRRLQTCGPVTFQGSFDIGFQVEHEITCQRSINVPHMWDWWGVDLTAGTQYTIEVDRVDCGLDPAMSMFFGVLPGDFPCTADYFRDILTLDLIATADDNSDQPGRCSGPWDDPRFTFEAQATGTYFFAVQNFLSNGCPASGSFRYLIKGYVGLPNDGIVLPSANPGPPPQVGTNGPAMTGDPHIKSWAGEWFEYMGECDLKLMHAPKFDGVNDLDVDARTTIRYDYSFIESAAIKIGEDILEVGSWGNYFLNGVEDALAAGGLRKTVANLGGYPIYLTQYNGAIKKHSFDIVIGPNENITISNMKDIVNVNIHNPTEKHFSGVVGMLGDYKGNMAARDGVTSLHDDINAMGSEWQVRDNEPMLFQDTREPQYPQHCNMPNMDEKEGRRLGGGISEEAAKAACARLRGDARAFANCVYDVTATNDLDMADVGAH